jgi:hypothetical protein
LVVFPDRAGSKEAGAASIKPKIESKHRLGVGMRVEPTVAHVVKFADGFRAVLQQCDTQRDPLVTEG